MKTESNLPDTLTLYFDGATEPRNPGGWSTYGWVILDEAGSEILAQGHGVAAYPGPGSTNNVAEYSALGFALRHLQTVGWSGRLNIFGDSKLVVNQMTGDWACNKEHLRKLRQRCLELVASIASGSWLISWAPREENERADSLSRQAYTEATGKPFPERSRR